MKTVEDLVKALSLIALDTPDKQVVFGDGEQDLFVYTDFAVFEDEQGRIEVCISDQSDHPDDIPY